MPATTIQKTKVQQTWTTQKMQEQTASALTATHLLVANRMTTGTAQDAMSNARKDLAKFRANYFRSVGVKTPLDLARAWAEYDTNMFGSEISFWGVEQEAHIAYDRCGCWSALERITTAEAEREIMCKEWEQLSTLIAKEFGWTAKEALGSTPDEPGCTITFKS